MQSSQANSPAPFTIERRVRDDGAVVLSVRGELDLVTAPEVDAALRAIAAHGGAAVLDLSRLDFMDSTGLRVVLSAAADARRGGSSFALDARLSAVVARLFEISGVRDRLPYET